MLYQFVIYSYSACLIVSIVCIMLMARQKPSEPQQTAFCATIFISISVLGYWFLVQADNLQTAVMSQKVIYIGATQSYFLMLKFYMNYCHLRMKKWAQYTFSIINTAIMGLALTCDKHKLFYKDVSFETHNGITSIAKVYGIGHSLYLITMIFYVVWMFVITIMLMGKKKTRKGHKDTLMLFAAISLPTVTYIMEKVQNYSFYLVPYGIFIAEITILYLVYEIGIYDFNDTAREFAYDTLDDGVLTIDDMYRFKGCNNKARELFPCLSTVVLDDSIGSVDDTLFDVIVNHTIMDIPVGKRVYQPEVKKIEYKGKLKGYVIWFYDVTAERDRTKILHNYQKDLEHEVSIKTAKLQEVQEKVIIGFANVIESRDIVTGGHIKRTSTYVNILIDGLIKDGIYTNMLTPSYISHIRLAAPLHDIGKMSVPDSILNKNGKFTLEEFEIMKKHTTMGAQIIDESLSGLEDLEYYHLARELALYHHEKWNGTGYPEGLAGEEIPLCARIMAVVDVFDALVSARPYKPSFPVQTVFKIIENERGKQFDPVLVDCFLKIRPQIEKKVIELKNEK
ncbi:MAG: histidine kinase N-terminal 7TM domain-containing protein [Oscillospiraceae bacterium]|nr:histidine kinase N-terminal 7TM domain-containing protein [Oscillospiraceae bacterium]